MSKCEKCKTHISIVEIFIPDSSCQRKGLELGHVIYRSCNLFTREQAVLAMDFLLTPLITDLVFENKIIHRVLVCCILILKMFIMGCNGSNNQQDTAANATW